MGFKRKDTRENVLTNYERVCSAIGIDVKNLVLSNQVHENRIYIVKEADRGKGIWIESDIKGYDGLATNCEKIALVTFYADCVPLYFFDPENKAIALSHSGWRGTVKNIALETIKTMRLNFGTRPENLEVAIGPCIGSCCFEVGDDVVEEFQSAWMWSKDYFISKGKGKWYLDLKGIILKCLTDAKVDRKRICIADLCTYCNRDLFFSHRRDQGKTGSLAAILQIR